jgi:putative PIN family toxin of toxin-antitoxin system
VLISAILRDRTPETVILFVTGQDDVEWIVSPEIMAEYRDVLSRPKFRLLQELLEHWFELLERFTVRTDVVLSIDFPRDQKDAKFLSCAIASGADFFVTGDRDFSQAQRLLTTTILSVAQFKSHVCDRLMSS